MPGHEGMSLFITAKKAYRLSAEGRTRPAAEGRLVQPRACNDRDMRDCGTVLVYMWNDLILNVCTCTLCIVLWSQSALGSGQGDNEYFSLELKEIEGYHIS